ncbi:MAG: hypothetical protein IKV06_03270 [Alistipes sp.]|nr:hypothetical protein [Alistipes sp.]
MKKINFLMALMMAFTLSFVACEQPEEPKKPEPGPGPEQPTPTAAFEVKVGEVTSSSIAYTVTPADLEGEYLCVLYDAETVEEFTRDQFLVENLFMELTDEARNTGKTLTEYMPSIADKGAITDGLFEGLAPEADYYIITFGIKLNDENEYESCTEVVKTKVTTLAGPTLDVTFEIETVVDGNSATYTIKPSNTEDVWYFYTLPKGTFDYYTSPDAYNMSEQQFLLYCLQMEIDAYRGAGYNDNQIMNAIFHQGTLSLQAKGLNANTEYINMVAGFIVTPEGQVTIATELTKTTYTTGNAKATGLTFEVSVTDIEAMRAAIKITPSNNTEKFCWMCGQWDGVMTAEDVMNEIVALYGGWMNSGMMLYSGVQDFTGGPGSSYKYRLDAADTDYYVIAFGYAGGVTSEPVMKTFRTLPAPAAEDTTFTMTASSISPYGFTVGVTPSESTTYYTFNVMANSEFETLDVDALAEELNAQFDEILAMQQAYDPNITVASVLSLYYYKGAYTANASGLAPETTCSGFVMALSPETGHVVKVHKFENIATTTQLGDVNPTVEVVGYYSGDEENGSVFGQPAETKGKSITVVKYGNFEGARTLFGSMTMDDASNAGAYPDAEIWGTLSGTWSKINQSQPYSFYVTSWDEAQTAFTYAVDNNGNPGALGRCYTMATVENKGNIEELAALVAELNASKSALALPRSLVVEQSFCTISNAQSVNAEVAEVVAPVAESASANELSFPIVRF